LGLLQFPQQNPIARQDVFAIRHADIDRPRLLWDQFLLILPTDVVAVGDVVTVWVEDVDLKKGRISLTMLPRADRKE
ncbi:hypothetical protein DBN73_17850, partial [Enterococcus faecalis]|uniref:hypothetical protein n=1 Tax=Enterococcus faecalis TaxID=1351 RepID=UPI001560D37B